MGNWLEINNRILLCRKCPRLVEWREEVARNKRRAYQDYKYWGKPVTGFGDVKGRVMIVGLAPGAHGSNRTGRMFTGDASGDFLYPALYKNGFANQPESKAIDDGLELKDLFITAICRCVPPGNRPTIREIRNCLPFLSEEIDSMNNLQGIVTLGRIAFDNVIKIMKDKEVEINDRSFKHANLATRPDQSPWILASYHPSRQNTQTGRLKVDMFDAVWKKANALLA